MRKKMIKASCLALVLALAVSGLPACDDVDEVLSDNVELASGVLQFFEALQDNESMPFTITEKARVMLSENDWLFQENKNEELEKYTDTSLEYKVLNKNIERHGDRLIYLPAAYVLSIYETEVDEETTFTELHLLDTDGNSFYVLALSAYEDIYEGDTVNVYALPIGNTSFENISGGTTLAIVLAGSYIEKMEW